MSNEWNEAEAREMLSQTALDMRVGFWKYAKIFFGVFLIALIGCGIGEALMHWSTFSTAKVFNAAYWAALGATIGYRWDIT